MTTLHGRTAVVFGGSTGVGRATALALATEQVGVTVVARNVPALDALHAATGGTVRTRHGDATDGRFVAQLLAEQAPDIVVLSVGVTPAMGPIDQFDWARFTEAWEVDARAAFELVKATLTLPLRPGSTVILLSSGAAVRGSPLSGGYAGAKRMQWFLAGYAQAESDARQLGIRFVAAVPQQLIEGTTIGAVAAAHYARVQGITAEEFMARYDTPLTPAAVADRIVAIARGDVPPGATAIGVTGAGTTVLT